MPVKNHLVEIGPARQGSSAAGEKFYIPGSLLE